MRGTVRANRFQELALLLTPFPEAPRIGVLAAAVDPRIKVLDLMDPWGDWPDWMAKSTRIPEDERANFVKPEFLKKVAGLDTVDWLLKLKTQSVRLQIAEFDTVVPSTVSES